MKHPLLNIPPASLHVIEKDLKNRPFVKSKSQPLWKDPGLDSIKEKMEWIVYHLLRSHLSLGLLISPLADPATDVLQVITPGNSPHQCPGYQWMLNHVVTHLYDVRFVQMQKH